MADLHQPFKITEKANAYVEKTLGKVEPKFVQQVVDWINKFSTTNGRIIRTDANIARVGAFRTAVERFLKRAGYSEMVANYLTGFDAMAIAQQQIHKDLNGIELTKSFINTFKNNAIQNVITAMEGQGLQQSLVNPLKQELFIAVNQGSSLSDVVQSISKQLTTTEQRQGVLKRIALQSSRDALGQYDGVVNEAVRNVYKLDALLYVGSLVKDSRPQCERWVDYMENGKLGLILFDQLQSEIDWALANGTGFIPETTPENFCQNRGGYNCRHTCYPVRNPNKITEKGNVKENVDPVISKKEQQKAIEKLNIPKIEFGFDKKFDDYVNDDNVNDDAKLLINRSEKPKKIQISDRGSSFRSSESLINMNVKDGQDTYLHEYGHHIDHTYKRPSESVIFKNAYNEDFKYLKKQYGNIDQFIPKILSEIKDEKGIIKNEFRGVSDILDSLTKGRVYDNYYGFGHGKSYFSFERARYRENFANIFEAWSKKDQTQIDVIKKYFPNSYKSFIEIIENL